MQDAGSITAHSIELVEADSAEAVLPNQPGASGHASGEGEQPPLDGTQIDPDKVKLQDIKKYEALMKGRAVSAISNASQLRGLVTGGSSKRRLYRRHNWKVDGAGEFGPMDLQFESGSNLISLNIDLTFGCTDALRLQKGEKEAQERTPAATTKPNEDVADREDTLRILEPPQNEPIGSLG